MMKSNTDALRPKKRNVGMVWKRFKEVNARSNNFPKIFESGVGLRDGFRTCFEKTLKPANFESILKFILASFEYCSVLY